MLDTTVDMLAGVTGGVAAVLVGQPLDTVKTNMQLYPNLYKKMFASLYETARQRGVRGLYAGMIPALVANAAENAVMFASYGQCQSLVANAVGLSSKTHLCCVHNASAGSISSVSMRTPVFTSVVLCPAELVKIRMQGYEDFADVKRPTIKLAVKQILKSGGYRGLYRGLELTFLRECVGNALFFGTYEYTREQLKPTDGQKENCDPLATMASGSIAGLVTWLVSYPIDVIKTRVQMTEKKSGMPLIWNEIQRAGTRGLYSGLFPTLFKTVPVTGVLLSSVEFSRPIFQNILADSSSLNDSIATPENQIFSLCDFLSGWMAGVVSTFVGHPMDTVRVIQQVTNTGIVESVRSVYSEQKFAGFYRGMMFPLLSTGVINSVLFGANGNAMRFIQKYRGINDVDVRYCCDANELNKTQWHCDTFAAGCVGGFLSTAINIPIEVVKTMLQASNVSPKPADTSETPKKTGPPKTPSPFKLIVEQYKAGGIRSLYKGATLLILRDVPSTGIYFLSYEHYCCVLKKSWNNRSEIKNEPMAMHIQLIAGGLAGVTSWIFVLPIDVVKTKFIVDSLKEKPLYTGAWDCTKKMYAQGGVKMFFRGFGLLCIRAFPVNGIAFLVYGILLDMCSVNDDGNKSIE
ncbi:Mitochondrial carrier protein,Mitochondrial carrier domain,Mitochondrial substrate/solute carrier [Cinara cedri]|uniref:Mitochondrial carrier protein,Mitochondrial carrier domain,Mitochondrial substrate/solute carrier n=1 Tax=Cinara cedri TaxID=506608 RepID=A0A5E4MB21_9HEMI|nr:Mitochondrial carrier protein,Mitochondrial carrier domain,Mitochondrial substrate/solute carrier [Cinara cedri]